ncbi:MAG: aldehyde ferredoxin oxidoreductase family protein [Chloroflexia bacterium]|nr:aldehyde ferredoxin oxidoreductase family protein [Chloroflexia bacterium]
MNGYGGTILRVNLSTGEISKEAYDPEVARNFLGGRGLGIYILYTEVPAGTDPLSPENKLIASTGPISGLLVPGAGKMDWTTKSPLSGGYASASIGGHLTAELKFAGYDSIIFEGVSEKPVYLYIEDDTVELRDAGHLWGKGCITTEKMLKDELGEDFQIATIGPGGENLVSYACIGHDYGRQAGRGGVGTIMGHKKVKAVAVRGTGAIPVADNDRYWKQALAMYKACKESDGLEVWQRYGTTIVTSWCDEVGALPTRNFQQGSFEEGPNLYGDVMREKIVITDKGCFGCPSPCGKYSHSKKHGIRVEGPEYETIALLGSNVALGDIEDVAYANYLADELGVDTISVGNAIAFAMECYEKGLIGPEETGGLDLRFGNAEAVFTMIERIARRDEGLGDLLAQGVKAAAQEIGGDSMDFAIQVKGMEQSGYETHSATSMLLAYMTCDVGAHHNRAWAITYDLEVGRDKVEPGKVAKVIQLQHYRPLFDALGACRLQWIELAIDVTQYAPMLAAITGEERSWEDLVKISERIWNLTRMYWWREIEGFGPEWDLPPARFYKHPSTGGPTEGELTPLESVKKLRTMYYEQRGWTEDGKPSPEKLAELGLSELVDRYG